MAFPRSSMLFSASLLVIAATTVHAAHAPSPQRTQPLLGFAPGFSMLALLPGRPCSTSLGVRSKMGLGGGAHFSWGSQARAGAGGLCMGRKRKGDGVQRSRWERRDASLNPDEPQPLNPESATGEVRTNKIAALVERRQAGFILVLEDPFNVNNAGAVLRSADAFGVTEAWIVQNGIEEGTSMRKHVEQTEKFEDDTIGLARMSSSASRWVKTRFFYSTQSAVDELKEKGFVNVATCFTAKSKSMYQTELTAPNLALWIGNEFAGLSDEALKAADLEMFIPMRGMIQSLNLSVASAICLNEVTRQRMCLPGEGGEERWLLPQEEQNRLAADLHQRRRGFRPLSGERKTRLQKTWRSVEPGEEGWVPGLDSNPDASVLSDDGETQEGGDRHRGVHA